MKLTLIAALIAGLAITPLPSAAQASPAGQWTYHAVFAAPPQKVIDTGTTVYYLSGGSLFAYDHKTQESRSYTMTTGLSAPTATGIYYNDNAGYLLIAYSTGNIDLLYDDGRVVNMSDISDSTLDPPLTINDVCFSANRIYVATNFGIVEFDGQRHEVVQSGIYSKAVTAIAAIDGKIILWADGMMRCVAEGDRLQSLDNLTQLYASPRVDQLIPLEADKFIAASRTDRPSVSFHSVDFANPASSTITKVSDRTPGFYLTRAADGKIYYTSDNLITSLDPATMRESTVASLPENFNGAVTGTAAGASAIWSLTRDGLACHSFASPDGVTVLTDRFRPEDFSVKDVCYFFPSNDNSRVFVTNNGTTTYRFGNPGFEGRNYPLTAARINLLTSEIEEMSPYPVEAHLPDARYRQSIVGKYLLSPTALAPDPDDPNTFYVSTSIDGIYKIADGKLEGIYSEENSPFYVFDSRNIGYHVNIDRGGNLWMHTSSSYTDATPIFVLPADKRRLNPAEVNKSDWITLDTKSVGMPGGQDVQVLHCAKSNMTFVADHMTDNYFLAYDDRGTRSNFADDRMKLWSRLIDQDGNVFAPTHCTALCEDRDGTVWIGTDMGVITIPNPSNAINDNMTVRRVKVPKNDGTNTAEYLLGADRIYSISVDPANRKWIATERSGLFLVSADGSEIIHNFTTGNSPLPSNLVYSVFADPHSATVYVGTPEGMFSYRSDATPAMESYDDITVYPNPVTPDYSGPVYVKGLMEGSLVKVADSAGNVLYQGRSEGGLFSWDGCNSAGARLPSGIYYIYVSQNASGSASGATAKFMIIN